jgi:hypothetical protein
MQNLVTEVRAQKEKIEKIGREMEEVAREA